MRTLGRQSEGREFRAASGERLHGSFPLSGFIAQRLQIVADSKRVFKGVSNLVVMADMSGTSHGRMTLREIATRQACQMTPARWVRP